MWDTLNCFADFSHHWLSVIETNGSWPVVCTLLFAQLQVIDMP
jgi:hypothetical protein